MKRESGFVLVLIVACLASVAQPSNTVPIGEALSMNALLAWRTATFQPIG